MSPRDRRGGGGGGMQQQQYSNTNNKRIGVGGQGDNNNQAHKRVRTSGGGGGVPDVEVLLTTLQQEAREFADILGSALAEGGVLQVRIYSYMYHAGGIISILICTIANGTISILMYHPMHIPGGSLDLSLMNLSLLSLFKNTALQVGLTILAPDQDRGQILSDMASSGVRYACVVNEVHLRGTATIKFLYKGNII